MGFFDFLFGKKKNAKMHNADSIPIPEDKPYNRQKTTSATFSKSDYERAIRILYKMGLIFGDSTSLKSAGGGRNTTMMRNLHTYACLIGYLYEYTYKMGDFLSLVDPEMQTLYAIVVISVSDTNNRIQSIKQLANSWSDVLQTTLYVSMDKTSEGNQIKNMQDDIDFVTRMFESLSGNKCRRPVNQMPDTPTTKERYKAMINEASFNPFNITTNPSLQNNPPLPPGIEQVFKNELMKIFNHPHIHQIQDDYHTFAGYVFNIVEAYYKNANYVPISTVDAIIEQCYNAIKGTPFITELGSIDDVKLKLYYSFTHK